MSKILAIDDKPDNLTTLSALLNNLMPGCAVITAQSGVDGIEKAGSKLPDVILLDVKMPGMDGFETCRRLKSDKSTKPIPVIMVTAIKTDSQSRVKGLEIGADAFLAKPIDPYELVSQVKVALRIKKAEDALRAERDSLEHLVEERTKEIKQSKENLEKERELFKTIVDQIPVMLTRYDSQKNMLFLNREFERKIGWRTEEVQNIDMMEKVYPDPEYRKKVSEYMKKATAEWKEFHVQSKSGDIIESEWSNIRLEDGTQIGIGIDITDRRKAERESLILQTAIDQAPIGIALADKDTNIYYCNPEGLGMRGGDADDLVEIPKDAFKNWQVLMLNGEPYEIEKLPLVRAIKKGEIIREEFIIRHEDGTNHICDAFACPIFENGKVVAGMVIFLDITKRKQVEDKYRSMMESFSDPLYICSPDFKIEYLNPAMIDRLGRDATGESCHLGIHGLNSRCAWCSFDQVATGKKIETKINSPFDGRDYRITNMPVKNNDGTISMMSIYRDITDYLEAVSQNEKAQKQIIQSQKLEAIGNLAGGIAHDFNNILSSILGFTELALDQVEKNSELEDDLQEVLQGGNRAKELVKQILAFARKSEEKIRPMQPSIIVKEVLKFIRSSIPTTIEIRQNINSDSLIMGNPTQIHQVIMNLCTNAAHAMEDHGGLLELSINDICFETVSKKENVDLKPGDYIRIRVSDTGTGIPDKIINSIFEPYFTTKGPGEGTGMGLSVVHGIVETYGGKITVDSRLGQGSTFTIYLPISKKRQLDRSYTPEDLPTGSEKILYVDDEATIAKMGKRALEQLGYSVETRTDSRDALELFRSKPDDFDLVMTDMTMPNMTGDVLASELISIRPGIPVILCSGFNKKVSDESATEIGIKAFVNKPFVKADLAKTIRKVLDKTKG